jgi:phage gp36-like protein
MANWITLTGDDIRLLDAEKTIMEGVTPLQDLDGVVTSASNFVRGYLMGGGNIMEPAPTVPPEVKDDVISISRYRYLTQEPTGTLISETRKKEYDDALAHLRDIANDLAAITQGELPPGDPDLGSGSWGSAPRIAMRTQSTIAEP